jgi:hypothetical protein
LGNAFLGWPPFVTLALTISANVLAQAPQPVATESNSRSNDGTFLMISWHDYVRAGLKRWNPFEGGELRGCH